MLIDNWKDAWKMTSVIAATALALFDAAVVSDFFGMAGLMSPQALAGLNAFVAALIPVLRVIKQQSLQEPQ